jgi:formylglycine-generating enzyme required for sulfatase activity
MSALALALALAVQAPEPLPCLDGDVAGMSCVPGGPAPRGVDEPHACDQTENKKIKTRFGPRVEVWVQTFYMDQTEVTIEAYKACVKAKKCEKAGPQYRDFSRPKQPVTAISWYQADAFCRAHGKRLPTEAEWEKAARGPDGADEVPACPDVVVKSGDGRSCGVKKKGRHPGTGRVLEVGQTPPGPYGLYEMRGNAEEWVDDWFVVDFTKCPSCVGIDPRGPCAGEKTCKRYPLKLVKGGSWYWPAEHARAWHRRPYRPKNKPAHHFGFRCAASVEQARALAAP